jgi:hypothetical protein
VNDVARKLVRTPAATPRVAGTVAAAPPPTDDFARSSSPLLPATSHTSVITQPALLHALIEPFLKGETPKSMFEAGSR